MRNELKARKKDNQRKVEEELQRGVNGRSSNDYLSTDPAEAPLEQNHALSACPQLPPTDHASTIGQFPAQQMYQQDHRYEAYPSLSLRLGLIKHTHNGVSQEMSL